MNVMVTHLVPMNVVVSSDTHYECYLILGTSTVTWAIEVIVDRSHFFFSSHFYGCMVAFVGACS